MTAAETASTELSDAIDAARAKQSVLGSRLASLRIAIEYTPPPPPVGAVVGPTIGTSMFVPGWVHTEQDPKPSLSTSRQAILAGVKFQGQHIQGWGAGKIWPLESGPKNWADLDRIFGPPGHPELGYMKDATIRCLYAAGCPAWMKKPKAGTNLTQLIPLGDPTAEFAYTPPHISQYPTWADFQVEIVTRYPQITHLVEWNETKGYWYQAQNRIDYEDYTEMYNQSWVKVKKARPDIKMGGPYGVLRTLGWDQKGSWSTELAGAWGHADQRAVDLMKYWLTHKVGADFFAMDLRNSHADYAQNDFDAPKYDMPVWQTNPEHGTHATYWPTTPWESWQKCPDIMAWYHAQPGTASLPFYLMELYPNARVNNFNTLFPNDPQSTIPQMVSVAADGKRRMAEAGFAGVAQWRVEGDAAGRANPLALWNSSGIATGLAAVDQAFTQHFGPGVQLFAVTGQPAGVKVLASATHLLAISTDGLTNSFVLDGQPVTLAPYEVRLIVRK